MGLRVYEDHRSETEPIMICYYTCNLIPPEFLARAGHRPQRLADTPEARRSDAGRQSHLCHPTTCPYVVRLLTAGDRVLANAGPRDRLVAPAGCDAMRRAADILVYRHPDRVLPLFVPRQSDPAAVGLLARDLERVERWLGEAAGEIAAPGAKAAATYAAASPTFDHPFPPRPGGVLVVAGPLSDSSFLAFLESSAIGVAEVDTCTGPGRGETLGRLGHRELTTKEIAQGILTSGLCPRSDVKRREQHLVRLLEESCPAAVIYLRQPFCDPGSYDALLLSRLASARSLPFLELEADYPFELSGPLRTRTEAFLETLSLDLDLLEDLL